MPSTVDNVSWMPSVTHKRHDVSVGGTLLRALKTRKAGAVVPPARISKEYYAFRYVNRPDTVDMNGNGTAELVRNEQSDSMTVERPSTAASGGAHIFRSTQTRQDDLECVLLYNEETGELTLEKIDTRVMLDREHQMSAMKFARSSSPAATDAHGSPPLPPSESPRGSQIFARTPELESDGVTEHRTQPMGRDEEPSDGEIVSSPPSPRLAPKLAAIRETEEAKNTSSLSVKSRSKAKVAAESEPAAKSKQRPVKDCVALSYDHSKGSDGSSLARLATESFEDAAAEEILDFGSAQSRPQTGAANGGFSIALPGSSDATTVLPPLVPQSQPEFEDSDDEENEWEKVPESAPAPLPMRDIEMIEEDGDGLDDLDKELNEEMNAEFGDDEDAMDAAPSPEPSGSGPIPLNDYADGLFGDADEDDEMDSEDSEEEEIF